MDDLLINAVFGREALWNPAHPLHKNVNILKKMWNEVSEELNKDEKTIRTRWKNLRAYYIKEMQRLQRCEDAGDAYTSSWQYFDQLKFLNTSSPILEKTANSLPDNEDSSTGIEEAEDFHESMSPSSPISNSGPAMKRPKLILSKALNTSQRFDTEKREEIVEDDDLLFFKSVLPFLKDIPRVRKLRLRNQINELILNELLELEQSNRSPEKQI